ncbi:MAG: undecaprenyldiphospho-muramoylpentapeptide beta-N-acetylglucosaminyltransferase [Planctomycetaceae bacterium]|nr:undecaprenyldiphospho-muramoylpentapeptide beta-N-acetylglucosaminyltransferase [Planctomycetaceae bacterium]
MADLKRILFTGGGTGGHLFPGLALVEELKRRFPDLTPLFVGSERGLEKRILREAGIRHESLPVRSSADLKRAPISFLWSYEKARQAAKKILLTTQPEVVIGLGGFASVPVVRAAQRLKIPTLLPEKNTVMGRANRWLQRRATKVCHAFQQSLPTGGNPEKHQVTGNPVRKEIQALLGRETRREGVQTILILGGSQGAQAVNRMWLSAVEALGDELNSRQIIHQTGDLDCEMIREKYRERGFSSIAEPFFEVLPTLYRQADLVISRAGATTLAELACAGVPAILIPYPNSVGDHQLKNAQLFAETGAASIVSQTSETEETLALVDAIEKRLTEPLSEMRKAMRSQAKPDAARQIVDLLIELQQPR